MTDYRTLITDLTTKPEKIVAYATQVSMEKSAIIQSGIAQKSAVFDELAASTGQFVTMPYWNDLTGDDEVLPTDGTTGLALNKITTGADKACINHRGKAWAVQDLVQELAKTAANDPNADPMGWIASRIGAYWARAYQNTLLSILTGIFADASGSLTDGLVLDVSGESTAATRTINSNTLIDAEGCLGDAGGGLTAMVVHSAVERKMRKDDLIDYVAPSEGEAVVAMYQKKRVVVDDALTPATGGVYTSYLFGAGAVAYGEATPDYPALETDRNILTGVDQLVSRRKFLFHPRGIAFQNSSIAGVSPTNAEFEEAAQWERVYDEKAIRIVKFVHKIA